MSIFHKKATHSFNMVEIVLAMGVVAIAIGSIMGLLPVALKANRDAVAQNCLASAADLVKSFVDSTYRNSTDLATFAGNFPSARPADPVAGLIQANTNKQMPDNMPVQLYRLGSANSGLYYLELSSGDIAGGNAITDFSALVKIWTQDFGGKSGETYYVPKTDTASLVDSTAASDVFQANVQLYTALPSAVMKNVVVEISYPAKAAENDRQYLTFTTNYAMKGI